MGTNVWNRKAEAVVSTGARAFSRSAMVTGCAIAFGFTPMAAHAADFSAVNYMPVEVPPPNQYSEQLSPPVAQAPPSVPANTSAQAAAREPINPFAALTAYAPIAPTNAPPLLTKALPPANRACTSFENFRDTDCPLTWHGITLYGTYDVGAGWVSHGMPENGSTMKANRWSTGTATNLNSSSRRTTCRRRVWASRARKRFCPAGTACSTLRPASIRSPASSPTWPATNIINTGLPRGGYSYAGDGARAGQIFNDEFYGGISSTFFGTLTFGRQRALGTDAMLAYDPAGGAYSFSFIGYNGLMAGGGDTQDTRLGRRPEISPHLWPGPFRRDV